MDINPLVSILMVNKNHGHFLSDSIESYLRQSYSHLEIVLLDGNSSDNSQEIAKKYSRVKLYVSEDESGSEAFVKGLDYCNGDFILFATSNDLLVDIDFISHSIALLTKDEGLSCVFGNVLVLEPNSRTKKVLVGGRENYFGEYKQNFKNWLLHKESFHELGSVFSKKVFFNSVGNLNDYLGKNDEIKRDIFAQLRFGFFSKGYKSNYINIDAIAVRDHFDRVSVKHRATLLIHWQLYLDQIEQFQREFLKGYKYYFINRVGGDLERLGKDRYILFCGLIIYHILIKNFKSRVKILLKVKR